MTLYLLDTNTVSDAIKLKGTVVKRLTGTSPAIMRISAVTEGELLFGLAMRPDATRLSKAARAILQRIEVVPWGREAAQAYGALRAQLQRAGNALAPLDMLIAAHAISLDATLVTANKAFLPIAGLTVQNWREAD